MTTGYITHPDFLKHEMGSHHPECPERIQAINDQLIRSGVDRFLHHLDAPLATEEQLELVHSPDHVSFVRDRAPESGYFMLDGDTIMNPHTYRASLRAAGAAIAGVDAVMKGEVENVFCAVRPPGHHAEPTRSMGFCLFDNVAIPVVVVATSPGTRADEGSTGPCTCAAGGFRYLRRTTAAA